MLSDTSDSETGKREVPRNAISDHEARRLNIEGSGLVVEGPIFIFVNITLTNMSHFWIRSKGPSLMGGGPNKEKWNPLPSP